VKGYPVVPKTIGDQIRKRRLDLGIRQIDAARIIGCNEMSIVNWERGHTLPRINHTAGVTRFLGCNPFPARDTLAMQLVNYRKAFGITQKEFARQIGVDPGTLARWERGERKPKGRFIQIVKALL
jgi:transcriptional regulator with XRE-family HTH domain